MLSISLKEEEALKAIRKVNSEIPFGGMQISKDQGQFLKTIVKLINAENILDIGTFTGYSALCFAIASSVNAKIISCELYERWGKIAFDNWKKFDYEKKIELKIAPAKETLQNLISQDKEFDLIFIDADKINYETYYELSLKLLRQNGVILIDNVFFYSEVLKETDTPAAIAIKKFNKKLFEDKRVFISTLPIGDGLTIAVKH